MKRKSTGFSLIEMMVVLVLAAILALGVMFLAGDSSEEARIANAQKNVVNLTTAIRLAWGGNELDLKGIYYSYYSYGGKIKINELENKYSAPIEKYLDQELSNFSDEYEIRFERD